MGNKMLIDAAHPEETRVVVLRGNRIEEFDFEAASKKQLRGNIYLAKVTRVEPSLQAAFVEYGGNRHGFLAFSEIHPDYYQIPVADRQQLLEDEARSGEDEEDEPRSGEHRRSRRHRRDRGAEKRSGRGGDAVRSGAVPQADGRSAAPRDASTDGSEPGEAEPIVEATSTEGVFGAEPTAPEADEPVTAEGGAFEPPADEDAGAQARQAEAPEPALAAELAPELPFAGEAGDAVPLPSVQDDASLSDEAGSDGADRVRGTDEPPMAGAEDDEDDDAVASEDDDEEEAEHVVTLQGGVEARVGDQGDHEDDAHEDDHEDDGHEAGHDDAEHGHGAEAAAGEEEPVEQLGGGDALEEVPHRTSRPRRHYKIQEVIKRRQVLLVQVVKEERGNKGAALTTYLSLAGRYSVLMPNTARGGGISRKIVDPEDRKRLKAIAQELDVPDGMGIILRTAGASRGMPEVRRDFEYLMRMWETVRETTLQSTAPKLVYEEGSLIKRSLRDLYTKEVEEVVVAGDEGYREARDFMRLLMPGQLRNVVPYRDSQPIFAKSGAEAQLDALFSNQVVLKSGGYLVINQTEALVAIDVNSGRSTREHNIEDTALRTNLEAADEIARQLRLRDLAGLIVVDFIDMEEGRNDRSVERRLKDALKNDRARIQIGRISHFGLLEMSRQRMRTGVLEGSTVMCAHCAGSGMVRSVSSQALHVLRLLEDTLIRSAAYNLIARTRAEVALYILNQKRANLLDLESRFGVSLTVMSDPSMTGMVYHAIERAGEATPPALLPAGRAGGPAPAEPEEEMEAEEEVFGSDEDEAGIEEAAETEEAAPSAEARRGDAQREPAGEGGRRRRRRRRRRGRDATGAPVELGDAAGAEGAESFADADGEEEDGFEAEAQVDAGAVAADAGSEAAEAAAGDEQPVEALATSVEIVDVTALDAGTLEAAPAAGEDAASEAAAAPAIEAPAPDAPVPAEGAAEPVESEAPRRRRSRRTARSAEAPAEGEGGAEEAPVRRSRRSRRVVEDQPEPAVATEAPESAMAAPSADRDVGAEVAKPAPSRPREPELPLAASSAGTLDAGSEAGASAPEPAAPAAPEPDRPKRSGWWQRAKATSSPS